MAIFVMATWRRAWVLVEFLLHAGSVTVLVLGYQAADQDLRSFWPWLMSLANALLLDRSD